jgi:DNA-directed RNA polymerase I subunit RPA2
MLRDIFGVRDQLNPKMRDMTRPQLESFNFAMEDGLQYALQDLLKEEFQVTKGPAVKLWYDDFQIAKPSRGLSVDEKLFPNEVRDFPPQIRPRFFFIF